MNTIGTAPGAQMFYDLGHIRENRAEGRLSRREIIRMINRILRLRPRSQSFGSPNFGSANFGSANFGSADSPAEGAPKGAAQGLHEARELRNGALALGEERNLTTAEIELVKSFFGDMLDFADVAILRDEGEHSSPAYAKKGRIHYPASSELYSDDFTQGSLRQQSVLIHEMVHVLQYHEKFSYNEDKPKDDYDYVPEYLEGETEWENFGLEEQAEIAEDYYLLLNGADPSTVTPHDQPPPLSWYEKVIPWVDENARGSLLGNLI